jgi:hypothetical protein
LNPAIWAASTSIGGGGEASSLWSPPALIHCVFRLFSELTQVRNGDDKVFDSILLSKFQKIVVRRRKLERQTDE